MVQQVIKQRSKFSALLLALASFFFTRYRPIIWWSITACYYFIRIIISINCTIYNERLTGLLIWFLYFYIGQYRFYPLCRFRYIQIKHQ